MWQASVDPMPSRISRPVRSRHRSKRLAGRASPAQAQARTLEKSAARAALHRREHLRVGRRDAEEERRPVAAHLLEDRFGRRPPGIEDAAAPTSNGKYCAFPSP